MPQKLSPKQHKFVSEYLIDLNATQAAIRTGYSPRTAAIIGFKNLRKPKISEALQSRQARNSRPLLMPRTGLSAYFMP